MENNKWLWQPRRNGPIYLRISYRDMAGKKKSLTRSLNTNYWPEARRIRDAEFVPIIGLSVR